MIGMVTNARRRRCAVPAKEAIKGSPDLKTLAMADFARSAHRKRRPIMDAATTVVSAVLAGRPRSLRAKRSGAAGTLWR